MNNFFRKFHKRSFNIKLNTKFLIPVFFLKFNHQRFFMKNDSKSPTIQNIAEEVEAKDLIRGEYENKIRAFSSVEKKYYLFSKKGEDGVRAMDSVNFFESLIPFPYAKVSSHDAIKVLVENNEIYNNFFKKIDINNDGKISFEEYIIFSVLLSIPISYFYSFSKDKTTITRESFVDAILKYIDETNVVEITNKSLFDGRQVKTDYDTFFVNLTTFTGKAFKNTKIDIKKEITDLKIGLNLSLLIYEFYRFPEAVNNKMSIMNFGRVLISYINIYKKQGYLNELKNIAEQFKDVEVTLNEFLSFFLYLEYLQEYLNNKNNLDQTKLLKLENLYEIEEKFRKSVKNSHFKITINRKHIELMFNLLDVDNSKYLEYHEIYDILIRRNTLSKKNSDYKESGNNIYKFFYKGLQFLKSYLWFLKKDN